MNNDLNNAKQTFWGDKRYYSLDYYLKQEFGRKLYKLSLNAGMTCPNRDGTIDTRGCIFCSEGGSGEFAASSLLSITDQIETAKKLVSSKLDRNVLPEKEEKQGQAMSRYIAYFQAYTNTYGNVSTLRSIFMEAISHPDIAVLSIATRPDCLEDEIIDLLTELNQIKPVWIELGLQTCHEATAEFIRRGYPLSVFEDAVNRLRKASISVIVHIILGLPGESVSDMLKTVAYTASIPIQGVKLQLLHILKNTDLAEYPYQALTLEQYVDLIIKSLELLRETVVVHRITGDGPKNLLIAPLWSGNKKLVLNRINQELKLKNTWQGRLTKQDSFF
ncbi:TIGR01212 family radical SAM protein [Anaerocolumna sp. AGMB13025]|uniref:TIGR01212 family radical SAM protein n=1 Tax=Anaerocolumna sp. AGMB13025 TaxID=3039116 RepID=UPI0024203997|nr:TIGR01212 family radical SAM protein [Anaerocolumna sp. AGMB13025]WFR57970.1 TIGR01212 family radical SAM protein [Anaerocolumna sp. AGMB13025]